MYKKLIAIVLALLFIMPMFDLQIVSAVSTGSTVDLRLYLHDNNKMDTDNTGMGTILFGSGGTARFDTVSLEKDMTMIAYEDGGKYGFWSTVFFNKGPFEDTTWRLTVIYNNSTIAETTYTITGPSTSGGGDIFIPFTESATQYVFSKDKIIRFEIQLQSGNWGAVQGSGEGDPNSANLRLKVNYLTHNADTYNKDEKTKQKNWTPNLPDEDKKIVIKGSIKDAFSNADFKETDEGDNTDAITISIEDPSGDEIHNDTISKNDNNVGENKSIVKDNNNDEYDYRYVFDYREKTMNIGAHVISIYVNTKQHTFKTTTDFTISEYGILISAIEGQDEDDSTDVVELFTAQKKEKELSLNITNTGSKNGDVKIAFEIIDETGGWTEDDIKLSDENFQLSAGSNRTIIATFTPPVNAQPRDFIEARIRAELSVGGSVKASSEIYVYIEIVKSYSLNLVADKTTHTFSPNEVYTFNIVVENNGGENDTYNFTSEQISGWEPITPDPQSVEVQAGKEYKYLKIKVQAPDFSSDNEYFIKIKGDNGKDGAKKATAELTLTIIARIGIKVSVEGDDTEDFDVETNKAQKTFYVKIENTDDEDHEFQLSSTITPQSSDLSVNMLTELNLSAGTSQTINVNVIAEKGTKAGNYNITITGRIKGEGKTVKDYINVNVKKYYKLEISLKGGEEKVKPGDEVRYTLNIKNLGNVEDTFTITPQSTWVVKVDKNSIKIDAGDDADITIKITAPNTAKSGEKTEITVEVKSVGNDRISKTEKFTLTIEKGMAEKLVDTLKDAWYFFILLIAVFIVFAYVQKQRKQVNK